MDDEDELRLTVEIEEAAVAAGIMQPSDRTTHTVTILRVRSAMGPAEWSTFKRLMAELQAESP